MMRKKGIIFWDFDGTLIRFTGWRSALTGVLDECEPGHAIDPLNFRPFLQEGFPWHQPEGPHTHLKTPEDWWRALEPVFVKCYEGVGYNARRAAELAPKVRKFMVQPERYLLYEDSIHILTDLQLKGWRHCILSNHIPELPQIVKALGLSPYLDFCFTSGLTGYEKPHPRAFRIALETAGNTEKVWMVGDSVTSDIKGAEAVGIPAILVHSTPEENVRYHAAALTDVLEIIEGEYSHQ
jgi:putative hydrolase of the HAD superfamily